MSSFNLIYSYLIQGDSGDYVLDEDGNRIIIDQFGVESADYSTPTNTKARKAGSISAKRKRVKFIRSFDIKSNTDRNRWTVKVNKKTLLGVYPSQSTAIDALYGAFMSCDSADFGAWESMQDQLIRGISTIDDDLSMLSILSNGNEVDITVEKFNFDYVTRGYNAASYENGVYLGWQISTDGGVTYPTLLFNTLLTARELTSSDDGADITLTTNTGIWANLDEHAFIRPVLGGLDSSLNATLLKFGNAIFKNETTTDLSELSLIISSDPVSDSPVEIGDTAFAVIDESNVDLAPGENISYSYNWYREIPELISIESNASPPAPSTNVTFSGTMTFVPSNVDRMNLTSLVQSGPDSADFAGRTDIAIRTTGANAYIEYLFDVEGTRWADAAEFMAGTTNRVFTLTANGQQLANDNALTSYNNTGTLLRPQLKVDSDSVVNSTAISNFWGANMNDDSQLVGDGSFEFTVSYDIVP